MSKTQKPECDATPAAGGSYTRQPDGSLVRNEPATDPVPEPQTETQNVADSAQQE